MSRSILVRQIIDTVQNTCTEIISESKRQLQRAEGMLVPSLPRDSCKKSPTHHGISPHFASPRRCNRRQLASSTALSRNACRMKIDVYLYQGSAYTLAVELSAARAACKSIAGEGRDEHTLRQLQERAWVCESELGNTAADPYSLLPYACHTAAAPLPEMFDHRCLLRSQTVR